MSERGAPPFIVRAAWVIAAATIIVGCGDRDGPSRSGARPTVTAAPAAAAPRPAAAQPRAATGGLIISPADYDFASNPQLLERVRGSAHGYYRFVNVPFSDLVCVRFAQQLARMPDVNLHGDAHVEQYAVTDLGRGLTDFDDSSSGPALIDLLRFGVSIHLAARSHGRAADAAPLVEQFVAGYGAALDAPEVRGPEPQWAREAQGRFRRDRRAYLTWADSLMLPVDDAEQAVVTEALAPYVQAMLGEHDNLPRGFFGIKRLGKLRMGIGSALDAKYLVRIEGPSPGDNDDQLVEAKEVRSLSGVRCVHVRTPHDPFRVLVAEARIAYEPFPYLGHARIHDKAFWIHGWTDNYQELSLADLRSTAVFGELVYDAGVQLGRGHARQIAAPFDGQLRAAQREALEQVRAAYLTACSELADEVEAAWRRFRAETAPLPATP